ncbi:hypothetical protein L1987_33692 [Smallanthus sonchifolius]|uniref:Uncharacterized protein n=1 Tax=Smallanthus sonchifolius TaxID=185202 RepID=A0ACB9HUB6_9ASTR|nr:hypothetical protein L1987_33692 [Smallanthus sonchifolius]
MNTGAEGVETALKLGKTLAFILPILVSITNGPEKALHRTGYGRAPTILVLLPTRELAKQGNYAVSGGGKGIEDVEAKAKSFKARMTVYIPHAKKKFLGLWQLILRLAVTGAFHTRFMNPTLSQLESALSATEIKTPRIPVISNIDAQPHAHPENQENLGSPGYCWDCEEDESSTEYRSLCLMLIRRSDWRAPASPTSIHGHTNNDQSPLHRRQS